MPNLFNRHQMRLLAYVKSRALPALTRDDSSSMISNMSDTGIFDEAGEAIWHAIDKITTCWRDDK